jgi:hypothetical protein
LSVFVWIYPNPTNHAWLFSFVSVKMKRLVAVGCFSEIIQWRKRIFIPTNDKAASILAAVIEILG